MPVVGDVEMEGRKRMADLLRGRIVFGRIDIDHALIATQSTQMRKLVGVEGTKIHREHVNDM